MDRIQGTDELIARMERLAAASQHERIVVGIDGRCAAGKSTLADELAERFCAPVVHMDDFFLPDALRTEQRLNEAGGNVHYERFSTEAAPFLKSGEAFAYGRFDCSVRRITGLVPVRRSRIAIVEGAYALHPRFGALYDIRVLMSVEREEQRRRILERNGPVMLERFLNEWIPMEERYLEQMRIPSTCDVWMDTTNASKRS